MASFPGADSPVNVKQVTIVSLLSIAYLFFSWLLVGFKSDQLFLVAIFNTLFYLSPGTKKFILGFSIFIVYWIVFDYMKAIPNYEVSKVHIADLYNCEKNIFGIRYKGRLLTPNEYWRANSTTFLDIMGGIFYLCWIPVPLAFAAYLFFSRRRKQFLYFSLTFVLVNFLGFIVYYIYPAAPPWYVQYHGFVFYPGTRGNTAGLVRFDNYFNVGIFKSIYSKGSNVFAAMPSLHSSYPVIVLYYGLKNRLGLINIFFGIVMAGIWFTAVYAGHHYILDVLAGIVCAAAGISLFNLLLKHNSRFRSFIDKFYNAIQ
jgi:hypothetical protein